MRRLGYVIASVSLAFNAVSACAQGDKKPARDTDPMAALAPFVGEWHVDGKWSTGETLKARGVYEWGLDKKILLAKTFVMDKDKEYQRYESIMAWHPEKKSLYEITFAFNGHISEVLMETKEKDTIHIGFTPFPRREAGRRSPDVAFYGQGSFRLERLRSGKERQGLEASHRGHVGAQEVTLPKTAISARHAV